MATTMAVAELSPPRGGILLRHLDERKSTEATVADAGTGDVRSTG